MAPREAILAIYATGWLVACWGTFAAIAWRRKGPQAMTKYQAKEESDG